MVSCVNAQRCPQTLGAGHRPLKAEPDGQGSGGASALIAPSPDPDGGTG
jgi:hypothetical protein